MSPITTGITPPIRSRTFTEQDARTAHETLTAYKEAGQTGQGVGYGDFGSAESARSAGQALNKMIAALGLRTTKWSTTTFAVDLPADAEGKVVPAKVADEDGNMVDNPAAVGTVRRFQGVMLPKDAKPAPAQPAAKKSGGSRRRS